MNPFDPGTEEWSIWEDYEDGADPQERAAVRSRTQLGGSFIFDTPAIPPCVWGSGQQVAWAQGESLMICGPAGVGKTTVAIQLIAARTGVRDWKVLGLPVTAGAKKVLYLAMDRPPQISRAMARVFDPAERDALDESLIVWKGPPPSDMAKDPAIIQRMADSAGADTVVVDSVKDAFTKLTDDESAANYNRCRQFALVHGCEVLELHHQRKADRNGGKPTKIDDVYGSVWLAAGAGSVILLWGQPGDPVVDLIHVKQPCEEIGPWQIQHDHYAGRSTILDELDLVDLVRNSGSHGLSMMVAAQAIFGVTDPSTVQVEKAHRRLIQLVRARLLHERRDGPGGVARYYLAAHERDETSTLIGDENRSI